MFGTDPANNSLSFTLRLCVDLVNIPSAAVDTVTDIPDPDNAEVSSTETPTVTPALDLLAASNSMQIAFLVAW